MKEASNLLKLYTFLAMVENFCFVSVAQRVKVPHMFFLQCGRPKQSHHHYFSKVMVMTLVHNCAIDFKVYSSIDLQSLVNI